MTTRPISNTPIPCMSHAESEHVPTTPENSYHALARLLDLKTEKAYEKEAQRMQREPGWRPPATPPHTSVFIDKNTYDQCHQILDSQARRLRADDRIQDLIYPGQSQSLNLRMESPVGYAFTLTHDGHVGVTYTNRLRVDFKLSDHNEDYGQLVIRSFYPCAPYSHTPRNPQRLADELMSTAEFKDEMRLHPAKALAALSRTIPECPALFADDETAAYASRRTSYGTIMTDGTSISLMRHGRTVSNNDPVWRNPDLANMRAGLERLTAAAKRTASTPRRIDNLKKMKHIERDIVKPQNPPFDIEP